MGNGEIAALGEALRGEFGDWLNGGPAEELSALAAAAEAESWWQDICEQFAALYRLLTEAFPGEDFAGESAAGAVDAGEGATPAFAPSPQPAGEQAARSRMPEAVEPPRVGADGLRELAPRGGPGGAGEAVGAKNPGAAKSGAVKAPGDAVEAPGEGPPAMGLRELARFLETSVPSRVPRASLPGRGREGAAAEPRVAPVDAPGSDASIPSRGREGAAPSGESSTSAERVAPKRPAEIPFTAADGWAAGGGAADRRAAGGAADDRLADDWIAGDRLANGLMAAGRPAVGRAQQPSPVPGPARQQPEEGAGRGFPVTAAPMEEPAGIAAAGRAVEAGRRAEAEAPRAHPTAREEIDVEEILDSLAERIEQEYRNFYGS